MFIYIYNFHFLPSDLSSFVMLLVNDKMFDCQEMGKKPEWSVVPTPKSAKEGDSKASNYKKNCQPIFTVRNKSVLVFSGSRIQNL